MGGDLIVNSIPTDGHLSNIFCPGAGDLPFDIIQHAISIRSLEPRRKPKVRKYFRIRFCLLAFKYSTLSGFWG
jgi:hypothetical protein